MPSTKKLTQNQFMDKIAEIHGSHLDFSLVAYKNVRSEVQVRCRHHGIFSINARSLLSGTGCKKCNNRWNNYVSRRRMTQSEWITKATDRHRGFYDYSQVCYVNSRTSVTIVCPIHGQFQQQAGGHLEGYGCSKCGDKKHGDYRPWFIKTYFERFPDKKNVPATLYLLYNKEENFFKVGITTKQSVFDRIRYMGYKFEIVDYITDTMYNVALAEQKILQTSKRYKPKRRFGGWSECLMDKVDLRKYLSPEEVGNLIEEDLQT